MAKFKFKGQPGFGFVKQMGDAVEFRMHCKDGSKKSHKPKGKAKFDVDDVIEENDERCVRHLRADPRFEEIA